MSQNVKTKNKKMKDKQKCGEDGVSDKMPKKFRLSFRSKNKKDKTKMTKGEDDDDAAPNNFDNRLISECDTDSAKYRYQNGGSSNAKVFGTIWEDATSAVVTTSTSQNQCDINESASQIVSAILDDLLNNLLSKNDAKINSRNNVNLLKSEINALGQDKNAVQLGKHSMLRRKANEQALDKQKKISHRRTAIISDPYFVRRDLHRRDSLYSVEEFDENMDENDNKTSHSGGNRFVQAVNKKLVESFISKPRRNQNSESLTDLRPTVKKTKSFSFKSIFGKPHKTEEHQRPQAADATNRNLVLSRKFSSTTDLTDKPKLMRTPSFIKKKISQFVHNDGPSLLKRSMSVRDLGKKVENKSREKLTEMKNLEWAQSRQSLVENDNCVSYEDMSFIDYDQFNTLSYKEPRNSKHLHRTQSLIVHGSPGSYKSRGNSAPVHYQSAFDISEQSEALSLPSLCHIIKENDENVFDNASTHRYQRRPQSTCSEDGRTRVRGNGSFRSAGSGCSKLKRTNACRQKSRGTLPLFPEQSSNNQTLRTKLFDVIKLLSPNNLKIARENLTIAQESDGRPHEWLRLVGSIRRRVQRHASSSSGQQETTSSTSTPQPISRKNSLTQSRFDFFKKSKEEPSDSKLADKNERKEARKTTLKKQRSIEQNPIPKVQDYFKGLTSKEKSKSASVKNIHNLVSPTNSIINKGVRKSDKMSSDKSPKLSSSFNKRKEEKNANKDDFLKATMRIFLVVSPPVGKIQVRSRSLNHLDTLEMRYGAPCTTDAALKDSRSEPDCTKPLSVPPGSSLPEPPSPTVEASPSRRHTFSRSQKSSSECFSINFEVGDELTWDTELIFPATRGVTLYDSLAKLCELRSIDLSSCDAWLQDKESGTHTWLSLSQDTASLVGRHIRITAQDLSNKKPGSIQGTYSRKLSGNHRPRASNNYFSSSTDEGATPSSNWAQDARLSFQDLDGSKKGTKQRWSGLFGNNKDTRMELLIDHLNSYTKHGVPTSQIYPQGQCESLDALYKLEGDWREIINCEELNDRQQQQQTALWELIKTEVAYIKTLKVVTDLFLACLKNLQSANLLKEIDTEKLFSNITEILDTNVLFWRNSLFPLVRDMRTYKQPPCIENMLGGFINIQEKFCAYFRYCAEQARCQHYCRENHAHNELFTAYLVWCETQKECNRLRLMDILVQPMQRLTKYGLLLKAILRNTDEEVERDSLTRMIKSVDEFVNNVNHSLKQKQDNERLRGIIARIESYDIVESKDDDLDRLLKSHCHLDLNRPMLNCPSERKRHLLLEGDLKLKDGGASKMEVHCFLLTDMLLVCKPSTKKGGATMRVIRQPYLVDRLMVSELNRETPSLALVYKNEFDMAIAAFILQNNDATILKSWKKGIAKAQALYAQAKQPSYMEESLDYDITFDNTLEGDSHSLQLAPRSPLASSSRASRVSSLAHSHSGSVEMNDQSSLGSGKDHSRAVSIENENRTGSISSDEGVQPLPPDRTTVSQKNSFKHRLFSKTPNTLSVQPYTSLGQSLPNLTLGSPNVGTLSLNLNQNTLSVPNAKNGGHLLSPTHRGVSYPPPSPTRGNLRRGLAISQNKNPPLIKTRHVNSTSASTSGQVPASFDFDVPVIAGVLSADQCENFSRGQHRQAMMKRLHRNDNKRYYTAGVVDDIKRNDNRDVSIHKRLSWNCTSQEIPPPPTQEDQT